MGGTAVSEVSIINLALLKLGAPTVGARSETLEMDAVFEHCRDLELAKHPWKFALQRTTLAPSATDPEFDYDYAFVLPANCLRVLPPSRFGVDWIIEQVADDTCILSNESNTLQVRFLARIEDVTKWDVTFVEVMACRLAIQTCEKITQSNAKKDEVKEQYRDAVAEAKKKNAFEQNIPEEPDDPWLVARL